MKKLSQDERLGRIETRLDAIDKNLERHMQRSDMLQAEQERQKLEHNQFIGAVKLLKILAILVGIAEALHLYRS